MGERESVATAMLKTAVYYDRLERWTAIARVVGFGGGRNAYTVHRALADPRAQGRTTRTRIHDLLVEALPAWPWSRVLDAGCGYGGTMLDLASRLGGHYTGLTLSARQANIGRRAIMRAGLADRVVIHVGSYDNPPAATFDLIYAIESLAHSPDPAVTLHALVQRLAPGGHLVIIDDMPEERAAQEQDLHLFTQGWRLPVLWGADDYVSCLKAAGLAVTSIRDLTSEVRPRATHHIAWLEGLNRMVHHLCWSAGLRQMLNSYHGGLALERLYRNGLMKYQLLLATNR